MMESMFHNCVSEFDLNLFEQTTNTNQASPLKQCPAAKKLGIARLKGKVKLLGQVVYKAKHIDEVLLDMEKELLETEQHYKETKCQLTEKTKEVNVVCDERNKYYDQLTQYSIEIQNLKEQLEKVKETCYDHKLKDRIISGYSDQVKGLQKEFDDFIKETKQKERNASTALKQAKTGKIFVEKKLVRLLKDFVIPTNKKRDRWLDSIIKKYLPDAPKEEEINELEKPKDAVENQNETTEEDEELLIQPLQCNTETTDFDCVESVDTGRGSSLAFSDGEKSLHSPDYGIGNSPPCISSNIYSKCKTDASTSPIYLERFNNSVTNICKKCTMPKKDTCTSPIPSRSVDVATNTSELSSKVISPRNKNTSGPEENNSNVHQNIDQINQISHTTDKIEHVSGTATTKCPTLQDFTFDTDDEDGDVASNRSEVASPVDELSTSPLVPFDEIVFSSQSISSEDIKLPKDIEIDSDASKESSTRACVENLNKSQNQSVNQLGNMESGLDDEIMHTMNPTKSSVFSPVDFNSSKSNYPSITSTESPVPTNSKINTHRNTLEELECLELNNSKNCNNDVEIDREIRSIFRKMRLRHKIITPIPATPPRGKIQSPQLPIKNQNTLEEEQVTSEKPFEDELNLFRSKLVEVFTSFIGSIPQCLEQIPRLVSRGSLNEELLRNVLQDPNRSHEKHIDDTSEFTSYDSLSEQNNRLQPNVVDLNMDTMLCFTETGENENSACNEYTVLEENSEYQIIHEKNDNTTYNKIGCSNKVLTHVDNKKNIIAPLLQGEKLDSVSFVNVNGASDDSCDARCALGSTQKSTHQVLGEHIENNDNTPASVVNTSPAITMSAIKSRNSIVYERRDNSDDEDDVTIAELVKFAEADRGNEDIVLPRRIVQKKNMTKLELLRLKMLPKSKIKNNNTRTIRKLRPRAIVPKNTIPKKKVRESDTAASLNDKVLYNKAVKVLAELRLAKRSEQKTAVKFKEPKVILKDCQLITQYKPKTSNANNEYENNVDISCETQLSTKLSSIKSKRKLLENQLSNSDEQPASINTKKGKRTSISLDENVRNKSPKTIEQKENNITPLESSHVEIPNTKRTCDVGHSPSETKEPKRKRTSVSDIQISKPNSNCEDITKPDSQRILRSTSHIKLEKENGSGEKLLSTPAPALCGKLQSKCDLINSETKIDTSIKRNHRITRLTRLVSGNEQHSSTVSSKENRAVSYVDLDLFSNEDTRNQIEDRNKLNILDDHLNLSLERKSRVSRQNIHEGPISMQDKINTPTSKMSRKNNSMSSSHADTSLLSNENKLTTDNNSTSILSLREKLGTAANEHRVNESTQDLHSLPEMSNTYESKEICYADLNLFSDKVSEDPTTSAERFRKDSLLCSMIQKHGIHKIKFVAKQPPEAIVKDVCQTLETRLSEIVEVPHDERRRAMKKLVVEIRAWSVKHFLLGFIRFLKNPDRKTELFNKMTHPPFPPMTKKEQVLIYVIDELQKSYDYRNIVQKLLLNIEYTLFALNKAPETFDVIEVMSHFYALICRSYQKITELRLFVIDAMYCLQLKSVCLVQQCLEVWMAVLPLGHMGLATCPLVICLVYLLHFFKCDDKFNRVQGIRNTLKWKYNYDMTDWNENKILDMFRTAVIEMRDSPMEKKTLRLSLLILAKRNGAEWCHKNIVKNMLQPLINDSSTSDWAKRFCVSLLGPLLKPYPGNMKVHYEMVIVYLMDMLQAKNSQKMQEAIISSLIYVDKNNARFHQFLANWTPKQVSPEFQLIFKDYVRTKTVHTWKKILSRQYK